MFVYEDGIEKIVDIDDYLKTLKDYHKVPTMINAATVESYIPDQNEADEINFKKIDPIKKFQFD